MVKHDDILVYQCTLHPPEKNGRAHYCIDCEPCLETSSSPLFAGALGLALAHRQESHSG